MDTVTQMLFGATVAQAGFRRRLGRRALAAGAILGLVPDLDVVVGWVGDTFDTWAWHRGPTHSVLFGVAGGLLLGAVIWAWRRHRAPPGEGARSWAYLAMLVLLTHVLIDLPTSYGTQLLWPLTDFRFAWDGLGIIDIVYSLALVAALATGVVATRRPRLAQDAAFAAIVFIGLWTLGGLAINGTMEARARAEVGPGVQVAAYPTLFQPFYRRLVVRGPKSVRIGYQSVLSAGPVAWRRFASVDTPAIAAVREAPRGALFTWFAMGQVHWTETPLDDGRSLVRGYDLRYGLPGESTLGFWGIEAETRDGRLVGPVTAFRQRPSADGDHIAAFLKTALGLSGE